MTKISGVDIHKALLYHCPGQAERMVFVAEGLKQDTHHVFLHNTTVPCVRRPFNKEAVRTVVNQLVG